MSNYLQKLYTILFKDSYHTNKSKNKFNFDEKLRFFIYRACYWQIFDSYWGF